MRKISKLINQAGLLLGYTDELKKAYIIGSDTHSLIVGATRSGKTRHIVLPTTCLLALAGESMVFSDPKGELYHYTYPFLQSIGYDTPTLDFENPERSGRYNFLQTIIDYVEESNIPKAIDATWDIVSALVGEAKGEKIWSNGECSIIACSIMCVVYDNRNNQQFQNLTNVYHFIGKMCTEVGGKLPLAKYLDQMSDTHPAKALVDISNVAPSRTRGSFFTSALATLRLFTNPYIYYMTCVTDFNFYKAGVEKQAIFIILPDEKSTYYSIASLFISLHYQGLVKVAKKHGGRLPNRVNYMLDEVGNFTKMPDFNKMITVGGGRGIRFNLFLQDFRQLDEVYGENISKIIRNNCENWVYLQTKNEETLNEISNKMGSYTIKSHSVSHSSSSGNSSTNTSYNLTGRKLLDSAEISKILRPYSLVMPHGDPCIMYAPDLSQTIFNELLGLGDIEYNKEVIIQRREQRPIHDITDELELWGIWNKYINNLKEDAKSKYNANNQEHNGYQTSASKKMFEKR